MEIDITNPAFWLSVGQIILIDILLGGDNAVVIALACRRLPPALRRKGILWGVAGAVAARIVLIFFALQLLSLPYLKAVGALLLLWIGVKLLLSDDEEAHGKVEAGTTLWSAVRTVIVADAVMSLDNVIAVAAAADGHLGLVVFGILVSVPIIVWGSKLVLMLIDRFPLVIVLGGALLGWIAGAMLVEDQAWKDWYAAQPSWAGHAAAAAGALFVVTLGLLLARRARSRRAGAAAPATPMAPVAHPGMLRLLVPVETSSPAQAIADYLRGERARDPRIEVQLLNVQIPADYSGHARMLVSPDELKSYYEEESAKALAPTRAALDAAGVPYALRQEVGHVAQRILDCAREFGADRIVMGRRGASDLVDRVLGSVASDVSAQAQVPVTLVH